jgi:4-diphosphocytidyl-2-C-methyl-D-erythritol kinase
MIRFPNGKINIGLSVVEKRPDGYHNIETIFYPLAVEDALEIVPSPDNQTKLHLSGCCIGHHCKDDGKDEIPRFARNDGSFFEERDHLKSQNILTAKTQREKRKVRNAVDLQYFSFASFAKNLCASAVKKTFKAAHSTSLVSEVAVIPNGAKRNEKSGASSKQVIAGQATNDIAKDNLVIRAYNLLSQHFQLPPLHFHLHKIIPPEAGLGGGSSDAAYTLKMLDEMFQLSLSKKQLHGFAEQLGADCPFFIENIPVFATGTGNIFQNIELDLSPYKILIVKPLCSVNTKEAYNNIVPRKANCFLPEAIKQPISEWKNLIFNDFEHFVFKKHPEIQAIKTTLYEKGALYASMSGSGSAVYGIFDQMPQISFSKDYITFQI